jgi:hypothetical protein
MEINEGNFLLADNKNLAPGNLPGRQVHHGYLTLFGGVRPMTQMSGSLPRFPNIKYFGSLKTPNRGCTI